MGRSRSKRNQAIEARCREVLSRESNVLAYLANRVVTNDIKTVKSLLNSFPFLVHREINYLFATETCRATPQKSNSYPNPIRTVRKTTINLTLLALAVRMGKKKIVDLLLNNYSDHDFKQVCDQFGNGLLATAIIYSSKGYTEIVKQLLEKTESGLDVNQTNHDGMTPLNMAVNYNKLELAKLLLEHKAAISISDLFLCCELHNTNIASLLLNHIENKSEMFDRKYKGKSLLYHSIAFKHIELAKLFMQHRPADKPLPNDEDTRIALSCAMCAGYHEIVELMLKAGVDLNFTYKTKLGITMSPLSSAGRGGDKKMLSILIENKKTDIAFMNSHGYHALYYAIDSWRPDTICLLLDIVDVDSSHNSCIGTLKNYDMLLIELFIRYYGHKTTQNDQELIKKICNKLTKVELGIDELVPELLKEQEKFSKLIKRYTDGKRNVNDTIKLDTIMPNGKPLLSYAVEHGYIQIFHKLCPHLKNINQKDEIGRTPLAYAAKSGSWMMFNELLQKNADIQAKDSNNNSILSYALEGLMNLPNGTESARIIRTILTHRYHDVNEANLKDEAYIQLLDFVKDNQQQLFPKLEIFKRCIRKIKNKAHILNILGKLSQENDKSYLKQVDQTGRTLLSHFSQTGNSELVEALINQYININVDQKDHMGRTPLFYALKNDNLGIIEMLLKNGACVNHVDQQMYTPLLYAVERKCNMNVINMLLEYKADLSHCDEQNYGVLCYAINKDHLIIIDELLPKMIKEEKCLTELCVASYLAKKDTKLYITLIETIGPLFEEDDSDRWTNLQQPKKWNRMHVTYSTHACQRAEERHIEPNAIIQLIHNCHAMQQLKKADHILKIMDDNICAVVAKEGGKITVITTYRIADATSSARHPV